VGQLDGKAIQDWRRAKKEKRRIQMKTRILAVAAALLASTIVAGQSQAQTPIDLKANVPFVFTVGDKTLPPGDYTIQRALQDSKTVQLIRSTDGKVSMMFGTTEADQNGKDSEPRLIFHRYGNQYFLSQIWVSADSGRELGKSRREKELASGEAPSEVAVLLSTSSVQR
jgi:hypothetical protein